jgi:hypothetical protein
MSTQVEPSQSKPFSQAQSQPPSVFMHRLPAPQSSVPSWHSSMSAQLWPSPSQPLSQVQVKSPTVLAQVACGSQSSVPVVHSSMSLQPVRPSPS